MKKGFKPIYDGTMEHLSTQIEHDPKTSILTLMAQNPAITYKELAASIHKSISTMKRYIQELKASGAISKIRGTKGGRWDVK